MNRRCEMRRAATKDPRRIRQRGWVHRFHDLAATAQSSLLGALLILATLPAQPAEAVEPVRLDSPTLVAPVVSRSGAVEARRWTRSKTARATRWTHSSLWSSGSRRPWGWLHSALGASFSDSQLTCHVQGAPEAPNRAPREAGQSFCNLSCAKRRKTMPIIIR